MGAAKQSLSWAANSAAFAGLVRCLERFDAGRDHLLRVLTYHRVDEPQHRPTLDPGLISARPDTFRKQMAYLASHCNVLSIDDLLDHVARGRRLPPRSVLITFDDAYLDFAECAWPVLKHHGLPVVLFVPTGYPGQPQRSFWWDRLYAALMTTDRKFLVTTEGELRLASLALRRHAFAQLKQTVKERPHDAALAAVDDWCGQLGVRAEPGAVLSWEALRRLAADGVTLAPHSRTHPLMDRIDTQRARQEALDSRADLEQHVGATPHVLAYPGGAWTPEVAEGLRQDGFVLAFTTERGINDMEQADLLALRRTNVGPRTSLALMRAQLLPAVDSVARWVG